MEQHADHDHVPSSGAGTLYKRVISTLTTTHFRSPGYSQSISQFFFVFFF